MKTLGMERRAVVALTCLALCAGCTGIPEHTDALLQEAGQRVEQARQSPAVTIHAAPQLQHAEKALAEARRIRAGENGSELRYLEHHADLANQWAQTALQLAALGKARETLQILRGERNELLMRARERELASARRQLERAQAGPGKRATSDPAALRETAHELKITETGQGTILTLNQVLFEFAQHDLNAQGRRALQQVADYLVSDSDRQLLIEGFTDSVGDRDSNLKLSQRRAAAVRDQLLAMGPPAERVQVQGHGENYPVASNATRAGRRMNRRVEIVIGPGDRDMPASRDLSQPDPVEALPSQAKFRR